jgi:Na+-translocating ferredoxin:NAD+ oxidoreductase RnfD subunit
LATFFIFKPAQDWWGSMPDGGPFSLMLLAATGVFIARKVHKLPLIVSFLGAYYLFFTIAAYLADPAIVMGVFRGADLHAVLYLTFFMVTDPPTSPPRPLQAIVFGVAAAAGCFIVREATHAVYFLPAGLLIANVLEAARRIRVDQRRRQSPAVLAPS